MPTQDAKGRKTLPRFYVMHNTAARPWGVFDRELHQSNAPVYSSKDRAKVEERCEKLNAK